MGAWRRVCLAVVFEGVMAEAVSARAWPVPVGCACSVPWKLSVCDDVFIFLTGAGGPCLRAVGEVIVTACCVCCCCVPRLTVVHVFRRAGPCQGATGARGGDRAAAATTPGRDGGDHGGLQEGVHCWIRTDSSMTNSIPVSLHVTAVPQGCWATRPLGR